MKSEMPSIRDNQGQDQNQIVETAVPKIEVEPEQELPREKINIYGEEVGVVDFSPEQKELKTKIPVVYSKGWGTTTRSHDSNIKELGRTRRVLAVDSPHGVEPKNVPEEKRTEVTETLENVPEIQLAKVTTLLKMMEEKGVKQADVVAHSEGGGDCYICGYASAGSVSELGSC